MRPNLHLLRTLAVGFALLVAGCSQQYEVAVKQLLNDPESARFSEVTKGVSLGDVCGYVNAKNAMGGYVGKTPFYYRANGETAVVPPIEDNDFRIYLWNITGSDSDRRYADLSQRCVAVRQWKEVCGFDHPGGVHRLCDVLVRQGNTASLYLILDKEFRYR
jgi:hypothetical protein